MGFSSRVLWSRFCGFLMVTGSSHQLLQPSAGEDTCATLQDTPGVLKEDAQPQPVVDYEALLARQGKGQHAVANTDFHFIMMLCRLLLWSSDDLV